MAHQGLAKATTLASGIVHGPIELAWETVAEFTRLDRWVLPNADGVRVGSRLLPGGAPDYALGCHRVISMGDADFVERLTALDYHDHVLRYKVVSADFATNPFPGTMMDALYRIQLWPVSLDGTTFFEYEAEWMTEPESVEAMTTILHNWMASAVKGLDMFCRQRMSGRHSGGSHKGQSMPREQPWQQHHSGGSAYSGGSYELHAQHRY